MRYGILSDIHGNFSALEEALRRLRDTDALICLGDIVGYGAQPNECCDALRSLGLLAGLKGNHEAGVLGELPADWFNESAWQAILWTREELTPENLEFLSCLVERAETGSGAPRRDGQGAPSLDFALAHGSWNDPYEYVDSAAAASELLDSCGHSLVFIGHTHCAGWFDRRGAWPCARTTDRLAVAHWAPQGADLLLESGMSYVINSGSVGQPRDGNPMAAFAILDSDTRTVQLLRQEYALEEAQRRIRLAGLPPELAWRLASGR